MAIQPNILSSLDLATYKITLYVAKPEVWNDTSQVINDSEVVGSSAFIIAESGSEAEYGIDNLLFQSTINPSNKTSYTTTGVIQFDLYEPLGFSLLERLQALGPEFGFNNIYGARFILKVEFLGRNALTGRPERLQEIYTYKLGLHSVQASLNESGATYNVIAYNTAKMGTLAAVTETAVSINNVQTVTDFLGAIQYELNQNEKRIRGEGTNDTGDSKKQYKIVFDQSALIQATQEHGMFDLASAAMGAAGTTRGTGANASGGDSDVASTKRDFTITKNSNIASFIANTINSEVESLAKFGTETQEKSNILPVVKVDYEVRDLGETDKTNAPGEEHVFKVGITWKNSVITKDPQETKDFILSEQKQNDFFDNVLQSSIVKKYDYLYTGQNTEVLDYQLTYNALFRVAIDPAASQAYMSTAQVRGSTGREQEENISSGKKYLSQIQPQPVFPLDTPVFEYTVASPDAQAQAEHNNANSSTIKYNRYVQYSQRSADFHETSISIKGDPFWLGTPDSVLESIGQSLQTFTSREISVAILVKKPDQSIADPFKTKAPEIEYASSGVYTVQNVESRFQRGQFTQTLTLYKNLKVNPFMISTRLTEL